MPNSSINKVIIIVGANGLIGRELGKIFEDTGYKVLRVSSKPSDDSFLSIEAAMTSLSKHQVNRTVVYLNYVKNPLLNLRKILEAIKSAKNSSVDRFFYFSTFAHSPDFCGIKGIDNFPRYRSLVTIYNLNKYLAECFFIGIAKLFFSTKVRSFIVSPGFIIGKEMLWPSLIRKLMKAKTLNCPPLDRIIPVLEVNKLGKILCSVIDDFYPPNKIFFTDRMTIAELIEHSIQGVEIDYPKMIEQEFFLKKQKDIESFPRELFYFATKKH